MCIDHGKLICWFIRFPTHRALAVAYLQSGAAESAIVCSSNTHCWPGSFMSDTSRIQSHFSDVNYTGF